MKQSKCGVIYARRLGNNSYKEKNDRKPVITVQHQQLCVYGREYTYKYLEKPLSLSGKNKGQVLEVIDGYFELVEKIAVCIDLPWSLKSSAFNNMALL